MELKWLEDFAVLVRTGSFSRAAQERHVTQPAFSRRIRALEYWLGVTLFDRSSFPVQLTDAGQEFLPRAQALIAEINIARQDLRLMHAQDRTAVRIVTLHTLAISIVPRMVHQFMRERPTGSVSVLPSLQGIEDHFDALLTGVADIVLTYESGATLLDGEALALLVSERIGLDKMIPVASPNLRAALPRDWLSGEARVPLLSYANFSFSDRVLQEVLPRFPSRFRTVFESPLSESLRRAALEGTGVAWLPESVVASDLRAGALVRLEGDDLEPRIAIAAYKHRSPRSVLVEEAWAVLTRRGD